MPPDSSSPIPFPALALAVCLLFAAIGIAIVDDYGVSTDETNQRIAVYANIGYLRGDPNVLPDIPDRFYSVAFEMPLLIIERILNLKDTRHIYLLRHILTHLFFIAGAFFCALLAWRMFNSPFAALLSMLLFLLHPRLYAHSFFNAKDIPFLSMLMIALYFTHRAFGKNTVGAFALCGITVGLAADLRIFGLMLLPLILAMRGLDLWQASGAGSRKRILTTAAIFAATALATMYAVHPYYWQNPLRFFEGIRVLSQHPTLIDNIFLGQIVRSDQVPPHYIPTWFGITSSPVALTLGAIGTATVLRQAFRAPAQTLRSGQLRFSLMLLICFILPIATAIALQSNIHNGWRHMYFLWAPFCLLAAAGLHRLSVLRPTRNGNPRQIAAYAITAIGLTSLLHPIISLHPHQHVYFNLLVDRETPDHLRRQFVMDYWWTPRRQGLEYLRRTYPETSLRIAIDYRGHHSNKQSSQILPLQDRQWLFFSSPENADFQLANDREVTLSSQPPGPEIHAIKIYNNSILTITAPGLTDGSNPGALRQLYRAEHQAIAAGQLLAEDEYSIYLSQDGSTLGYIKSPCALPDTTAPYFLHIFPKNEKDLPPAALRHGFENLDFHFAPLGRIFDGKCQTIVPLPDYPITRIRTGQHSPGQGQLWQVDLSLLQ